MDKKISVIGAGLAGCATAKKLIDLGKKVIIYEKDKVGGLCIDCQNYQEFVHIVHTNNEKIFNFFDKYTTIRDFRIKFLSYVEGEYWDWYPKKITQAVIDKQIKGYSKKMWKTGIPPEAEARLRTSQDGFFFHDKYEFIPDFTFLFDALTVGIPIRHKKIKDGDIKSGKIILTGPIDEYFGYVYGKLPYRGIKSTHVETEVRLKAECINFSDPTIPFTRLVDYKRLGFKGNWIGIETPSNDDHYPIRDKESEKIYEMYRLLAEAKGITLLGRQATFRYMDVDQVIEQVLSTKL